MAPRVQAGASMRLPLRSAALLTFVVACSAARAERVDQGDDRQDEGRSRDRRRACLRHRPLRRRRDDGVDARGVAGRVLGRRDLRGHPLRLRDEQEDHRRGGRVLGELHGRRRLPLADPGAVGRSRAHRGAELQGPYPRVSSWHGTASIRRPTPTTASMASRTPRTRTRRARRSSRRTRSPDRATAPRSRLPRPSIRPSPAERNAARPAHTS